MSNGVPPPGMASVCPAQSWRGGGELRGGLDPQPHIGHCQPKAPREGSGLCALQSPLGQRTVGWDTLRGGGFREEQMSRGVSGRLYPWGDIPQKTKVGAGQCTLPGSALRESCWGGGVVSGIWRKGVSKLVCMVLGSCQHPTAGGRPTAPIPAQPQSTYCGPLLRAVRGLPCP